MKLPGSNFSKGQPPDDGPTLDELREPAIWLRRAPGLNVNSRLGGLPSLPEGIAWPRQSVNGLPLHFLAQIDFSELPRSQPGPRGMEALPERGFAYFFADIEEEMLWGFGERGDNHAATRVIYSPKAHYASRRMMRRTLATAGGNRLVTSARSRRFSRKCP